MPWGKEQDKLTQEARLLSASPEVVFQELKNLSGKADPSEWDDQREIALAKRNQPLINLGLACYGANKGVFAALYKYSLEPAKNDADAKYKKGLRLGCLSNTTISKANLIRDFPNEIIGPAETSRVLFKTDDEGHTSEEAWALIRNPSISDDLLTALYKRAGMFAQIPEDTWRRLVSYSSRNERLTTKRDTWGGPDLGFMDIQNAIFTLLEIAPLETPWIWALYDVLDRLPPEHVATPEKIDHVLSRWGTVDARESDGKEMEGLHTPLSINEEFRCLIGALYGRGYPKLTAKDFQKKDYSNYRSFVHGSPDAKDIALRCAYYGKGDITPNAVRAGYKRDDKVFAFAVLFNDKIYDSPELRKPLQEKFWGGMFGRYSKFKKEREERKRQEHEELWGAEDTTDSDASDADNVELASQRSGVEKAFGLVGYAWQIGVNLLYLAIIVWVLSRTSQLDPKLTIVVATLGLIYVAIQGQGMSQAQAFSPLLIGIAKSLDELKGPGGKRIDTPEAYAMAEKQLKRGRIKFYIQGLFLSLTSLICLYAIYTALTH
jgi:hypothetical protein